MKKIQNFRNKIDIKGILIIAILSLFSLKSVSQCSSICITNMINIGTGHDHQNAIPYLNNTLDQYWTLVAGPSTYAPYPQCAVSQGTAGGWIASPTSCPIGVSGNGGLVDGTVNANVPCS